MGKDFDPDPRYPEDQFPEGIAGNPVDKRGIDRSGDAASKRVKDRGVADTEHESSAEGVDKANSVLERLVERGVVEFREEPEPEAEEPELEPEEAVGLSDDEFFERFPALRPEVAPDPEGDVKADLEAADEAESKSQN